MTINFNCKTNKDYVSINTLKVQFYPNLILTIDRTSSRNTPVNDGKVNIAWDDIYLWLFNDASIFGENGYHPADDPYTIREFTKLLETAKLYFEPEDEAEEDYKIKILDYSVC